jgi:hemoglobin/transferrin/lactoferrin receptor protein
MRITPLALGITAALYSTMSLAEETQAQTIVTSLDAVTVTATRTEKSTLKSAQAINVVSAETMELEVASSVFDVLDMVPNTSVTGGPRGLGQKFSVRGFDDAEDVLVTVDGAIQTFEKYRMGSFFGDSELYRTVSIKRGPSTVLHGGGALGGLVQVEMKDASDFLGANEKYGTKVKLGYDSNNEQKNASVFGYARPTEALDLLIGYVDRNSNDFELSNGEMLESSGTAMQSFMAKAEYYLTDEQLISLSVNLGEDDQLTEFNNTDPGPWGVLRRATSQDVTTLSYSYQPEDSAYIDLKVVYGNTQSHVTESDGTGPILPDYIGIQSHYEYNIDTLDIVNTSRLGAHTLTYGVQYSTKDRVGEKTGYPCLQYDPSGRVCVANGDVAETTEITSQPGGTQERLGVYVQDEYTWQDLTLIAGVRYETYDTTATNSFAQALAPTNTKVSHDQVVPATSVIYQINEQFSTFVNYQEGFRAPLLDEVYDQYQGRLPNLNLDIESSTSKEVGLTFSDSGIFSDIDALTARAIYFDISVDNEILSITDRVTNPMPGPRYNNIGANDRDGIEFEVNYSALWGFTNFTYSNISGTDQNKEAMWYLPANKIALNTGFYFFDGSVTTGLKVLNVGKRKDVQEQDRMGNVTLANHDAYTLVDLYVNWAITESLNLGVAVDNLLDEEYQVIAGSGGAVGEYGISRNIKTQLSFTF